MQISPGSSGTPESESAFYLESRCSSWWTFPGTDAAWQVLGLRVIILHWWLSTCNYVASWLGSFHLHEPVKSWDLPSKAGIPRGSEKLSLPAKCHWETVSGVCISKPGKENWDTGCDSPGHIPAAPAGQTLCFASPVEDSKSLGQSGHRNSALSYHIIQLACCAVSGGSNLWQRSEEQVRFHVSPKRLASWSPL